MANLSHWKRPVKDGLLSDGVIKEVVSESTVEGLCQASDHQWRSSFWCPTTTVLTFLLQVIDSAKTLRAAVATVLTHKAAQGEQNLPSCDPSAYCQSRKRLPFKAIYDLLHHVTSRMQQLVNDAATWHSRRLWIVDGSSVSTPDTPALQREYPQPCSQKPGCGFPIIQFVALFCWSTGAVIDVVLDTIIPHELSLFRRL